MREQTLACVGWDVGNLVGRRRGRIDTGFGGGADREDVDVFLENSGKEREGVVTMERGMNL